MSFLPAIIRDGHPSLNQFIRKALTIDKHIGYDPKILAPLQVLEVYPFSILENIGNHFFALLSVIFFLFALSIYLRRINSIDPDGYLVAYDRMQAGQVESDGIAVIIADIDGSLNIAV